MCVCVWMSVHELLKISGVAVIISMSRGEKKKTSPGTKMLWRQTFRSVCAAYLASGSHIYKGDKQ